MDLPALESNSAILKSKKRKIPAHTDIKARLENSALLTNYNRAGLCNLTAKQLNAAIFWIAVATVTCRTLSLFMCHV